MFDNPSWPQCQKAVRLVYMALSALDCLIAFRGEYHFQEVMVLWNKNQADFLGVEFY